MDTIINLTQHAATPEQIAQGLEDPNPECKAVIQRLLTFSGLEIKTGLIPTRARLLAGIASDLSSFGGPRHVLIGGLPALMKPLVEELRALSLEPVFSHSDRDSADELQPDGSVKKVARFCHQFFYVAP